MAAVIAAAAMLATAIPAGEHPARASSSRAPFPHAVAVRRTGPAVREAAYLAASPADPTRTTLTESGGGGPAGLVTLTATVAYSARTDSAGEGMPVTAGAVSFYGGGVGASGLLGTVSSGAGASAGVYSLSVGYARAGAQSVVAVYSPPAAGGIGRGSVSAPVTFTEAEPACATCTGVRTVDDLDSAGVLSISTPYTGGDPLDLGQLALNDSGTYFSASAPLDPDSADVPSAGVSPDPAFSGITVVDAQASNTPWSITALASDLGDGSSDPAGVISGENVGLTGLTAVTVPGSALTASDLTFFDQPAASPPVGPADTGSLGLGGQFAHVIVADSTEADGTIGINGTITINAPTSTEAGLFAGIITLTIAS